MNKAGRKPKGWKPPYSTSLQVIKKDIILTFDDDDIKEIERLGYDIKKLTCLHHVFKNKLM